MNQSTELPIGLAAIAQNRDFITTPETAKVFSKAEQTLRKEHSLKGSAFGVKPIKVGNRLLWSVEAIAKVLRGGK